MLCSHFMCTGDTCITSNYLVGTQRAYTQTCLHTVTRSLSKCFQMSSLFPTCWDDVLLSAAAVCSQTHKPIWEDYFEKRLTNPLELSELCPKRQSPEYCSFSHRSGSLSGLVHRSFFCNKSSPSSESSL